MARIHARDGSDYPSDTDIAKNYKVDADKSVFLKTMGNQSFATTSPPNTPTKITAPINGTKTFVTASPES